MYLSICGEEFEKLYLVRIDDESRVHGLYEYCAHRSPVDTSDSSR